MTYKTKTLRRWSILVTDQKTFRILSCPTNKQRLEVVDEKDMFGPIKRYYEFDSSFLLSDRQLTIKLNQLKKQGYSELHAKTSSQI